MNQNSPSSNASPVRLKYIALAAAILFVIGLAVGLIPRWIERQKLRAETRAESIPSVEIAFPKPSEPSLGTPLPADVRPFMDAAIHARASGYLKKWYADIGDNVTNGQLLAEIETPELDQQLAQAKAQLEQAKASLGLAKTTAERWEELRKTASVSDQETAEKTADYALQKANVAAAEANVERLANLKNFDYVTAPFAGTITMRNTDIGRLITADSGPELFHLAQTDPLRVYVRVPQTYIHAITPEQTAELTFQELPGRIFTATVTRTAGAVDATSRTLLVELQVPNPNREIFSGSYAQVQFNHAVDGQVPTISDNALIFRAEGMQAAVVGDDNKVTLRSIKLGRDFGNILEVVSGLSTNDRVILNPPDSITDGMTVEVAAPAENPTAK